MRVLVAGIAAALLLAACARGGGPDAAQEVARRAVPGSVLPRAEVVARAERRLSPPGQDPISAKLTTWRELAPVVAVRKGSHTADLVADPDRWLWALSVGAPDA